MEKKLLDYGFSDLQVSQLLKTKKLNTGHGQYKIMNGQLFLKRSFEDKYSVVVFDED